MLGRAVKAGEAFGGAALDWIDGGLRGGQVKNVNKIQFGKYVLETWSAHARTRTHAPARTHAHTHAHLHARPRAHMHTHPFTDIHARTRARTRARTGGRLRKAREPAT